MRPTTLEVDTELAGARKAALYELFDSPGGDPACNQCRDSSQRGMLLGERASLAAALIGLHRPCPGQAHDKVGQQRDDQKTDDDHTVLEVEREMSIRPVTEVRTMALTTDVAIARTKPHTVETTTTPSR